MTYRITWTFSDGTTTSFDFVTKHEAMCKYEEGKVYGNVKRVRGERIKPAQVKREQNAIDDQIVRDEIRAETYR